MIGCALQQLLPALALAGCLYDTLLEGMGQQLVCDNKLQRVNRQRRWRPGRWKGLKPDVAPYSRCV